MPKINQSSKQISKNERKVEVQRKRRTKGARPKTISLTSEFTLGDSKLKKSAIRTFAGTLKGTDFKKLSQRPGGVPIPPECLENLVKQCKEIDTIYDSKGKNKLKTSTQNQD